MDERDEDLEKGQCIVWVTRIYYSSVILYSAERCCDLYSDIIVSKWLKQINK